jgi:uncharacterized protein (DUF1499 family)
MSRKNAEAILIGKPLERVKGIEPSSSAWEAAALPLSYTRIRAAVFRKWGVACPCFACALVAARHDVDIRGEHSMAEEQGRTPHPIVKWIARIGVLLGIGAPVAAVAMALGTGAGMIDWQTSLGSLRNLTYAAMAGGGLSLLAILALLFRKHWRRLLWPVVAIVAALGFVGYASYSFGKAATVPPIHDITTDLSNPPDFETLTLRADNRETVPDGDRAELAELDNAARWRRWHEEGYADIQPILVPVSVPDAVAAAEQLVADRGWELAVADPATGRLEATETVSIYRFKDDVVLRITPNPNGEGCVVNMRSVSRVGISDLGVNGDRIRAFLADLTTATGG